MPRFFRARPERTVTLPQSLIAGPGATNMRMFPGDVVTLEDAACVREGRFINNRLNAGDLEELATLPAGAEGPTPVPSPFTEPVAPTLDMQKPHSPGPVARKPVKEG